QPVLRHAERREEPLGRQLLRAEISAAIGTEKNSKDLERIVEVVRCALARLEHDDACLRTACAERADNAKPAVLVGVARQPRPDELAGSDRSSGRSCQGSHTAYRKPVGIAPNTLRFPSPSRRARLPTSTRFRAPTHAGAAEALADSPISASWPGEKQAPCARD